ncbi:hypothetical protein [Mycolicibacterium phlei]|uniref:hypothetical protein n=1 Tax=Mycolicibacterium phlei TaxID=1771 RepID=UPI00103DA137|nr:hypothetical protein [Mycolicibacterium phlei]MBF4194657.1 hypothetical protein [Mycolicibacterium phlei]
MILVAGPPCGGKSTFVSKNAGTSDKVLDFDDLVEQICGDRHSREPDVVSEAMTRWKAELPTADWVIHNAPRRRQRGRYRSQYGAQVIVVTASKGVCLERARNERPEAWIGWVHDWFAQWEPSRTGEWIVDTTPK